MNANWSDILWYLAIGAFFVMMLRGGGCCGGHGHKKSSRGDGSGTDDHQNHHEQRRALQSEALATSRQPRPTDRHQGRRL